MAATRSAPGPAEPGRSDPGSADDPVRARRERIRRWVSLASRLGYGLLAVAIVMFFVALLTEFNSTMATIVIAALITSWFLLAPSIVLGYAVKAADREDREQGL